MTEIERLIDMIGCGNSTPQERIRWARSLVDLARSEGKAEGKEQTVRKIREAQLCGYRIIMVSPVAPFPDDERRNCAVEIDIDGVAHRLVPASVLAPKEIVDGRNR